MDPVLESEIYDPVANAWAAAASSRIARMYHSFALLLPDGHWSAARTRPRWSPSCAWTRVPRILMAFEKDAALLDLTGPFGGIRNRRELAEAFEAAWARRQSEEPGDPIDGLHQRFQDSLRAWLRWHRGMLVGELVPEALA
jgi:hypothetical protein